MLSPLCLAMMYTLFIKLLQLSYKQEILPKHPSVAL